MFKLEINSGKLYFYILTALVLLSVGCSKGTNTGIGADETKITGSVIEDVQGNCRFANESDCMPIEIRRGEDESEEAIDVQETAIAGSTPNKTVNLSKQEVFLSNCEEAWKCVEKNYRAYQYANCSWISIEYCVYGCKNGTCNHAPTCKLNSLKCDKDNSLKCIDGYEWVMNESCDYKCESGICISKNATIQTNTTNSNNTTNSTQGNDFISDNCIGVLNFNYAPAGNNLSQEYFTLKNSCSYSVDMGGWTARDDTTISNHIFTFPVFGLDVNAELSVHTGNGTNTSTDLYFRKNFAVWNNDDGDTLYLKTQSGTSVLTCHYPNNGSISNCPDL